MVDTQRSTLLFICGFPSGGTDLSRSILNSHPEIYINGEMPLLKNIARFGYHADFEFRTVEEIKQFQAILRELNEWGNIKNIDEDFESRLAKRGTLSLEEVLRACFNQREVIVWGNKTPQNTENIAELARLFPHAKFLVISRDVRDICLSWHDKWGKDMYLCADKWTHRMRDGWNMSQQLEPGRVLWVKYERLLDDLEAVTRELCSFLRLEYSSRMLEYHLYVEEIIDGKINYGQPIKRDNQGKWKRRLTEKSILRLEQIAYPTMVLLGYPPQAATMHIPLTRTQRALGKLVDLSAMILIGNRASANNSIWNRIASVRFEFKKRKYTDP